MKKKILHLISPLIILPATSLVVSCSKTSTNDFEASEDTSIYSNIWNLSLLEEIPNSAFELKIADIEKIINDDLKKDKTKNMIFKVYCFYILWQAIKNPLTRDGKSQSNLSSDITSFSTFLNEKLVADNKDEKDEKKKTYHNFAKYINKISYEIKVINFDSPEKTLREIFKTKSYVLDFQIKFKINDEDTEKKMVSSQSGKSIMFKTNMNRSERKIVQQIKDEKLKEIVTNQFIYQSTKLFYDVENKEFSTIILPSNVYRGINSSTPNSGFSENDKKRSLFVFDWDAESKNSTSYKSTIKVLLDLETNFNIGINTDWKNFLIQEKLLDSDEKALKKTSVDLKRNITYDDSKYNENE